MLSLASFYYFERQRRYAVGCLGVGHGGEVASKIDGSEGSRLHGPFVPPPTYSRDTATDDEDRLKSYAQPRTSLQSSTSSASSHPPP